jgi:hypothetical protein
MTEDNSSITALEFHARALALITTPLSEDEKFAVVMWGLSDLKLDAETIGNEVRKHLPAQTSVAEVMTALRQIRANAPKVE